MDIIKLKNKSCLQLIYVKGIYLKAMCPEKIYIPPEVELIIKILNDNKHEAYVVGGSVRDAILGKMPKDWDITTSALPQEVKMLFDKTVDTGLKHGTVSVLINNQRIEVTTFRLDGKYSDNRRPENVIFTASLKEDLSRRDFTINAIAYHFQTGYIDPFGGIDDAYKKIIRTVGSPDERFNEDALRLLRAVRFAAQLDFGIDESTLKSIKENSHLIQNISSERVRDELTKILMSDNPIKLYLLSETSILKYILPELDICFKTEQNTKYHIYNVGLHTLYAVSAIEKNIALRWTMLLHDIGKPSMKTTDEKGADHFYNHPIVSKKFSAAILNRLKFDNDTRNRILRLIEHHDRNIVPDFKSVRRAVYLVGEDIFLELMKVKEADKYAQNPEFAKEGLEIIEKIKNIYQEIKEANQCVSLKSLSVNGNDLSKLGFKGKDIGRILNNLLEAVIENPELNEKDKLIHMIHDNLI